MGWLIIIIGIVFVLIGAGMVGHHHHHDRR